MDMWESIFLQCAWPVALEGVESVIDFGSGRNLSSAIVSHYGLSYTTVDVADTFSPDVVSEIKPNIKGLEKADFVGCYQCLEHNDFSKFIGLVNTLSGYSKKYVSLSLPYNGAYCSFNLAVRLPKIAKRFSRLWKLCGVAARDIDLTKLDLETAPYRHHRWEVGHPSYKLANILRQVEQTTDLKSVEIRHNRIFPEHIFLLFEKSDASLNT